MKGGFYSNRPRYEERRHEAEARQADYSKLTPAEKLAKLDRDGFAATRQRARLAKAMNPTATAGKAKKTTTIIAPYFMLPGIEKAMKDSDIDEVRVIVGMVPAPPKGPAFVPSVVPNSRAERRRARQAGK